MKLKCKISPLSYKQPVCIINCGDIPEGRNLVYLIENATSVTLRNCFTNSFSYVTFRNPRVKYLELVDYQNHKNMSSAVYCGPHLRVLIIDGFNIEILQSLSYTSCQRLLELVINNVNLAKIEFEAFYGLIMLNKLDLADNKLTDLKEKTFSALVDLKHLRLTENRIKMLSQGWFKNTSVMPLKIEMNNNQVTVIARINLPEITNSTSIVNFSHNQLQYFLVNEHFMSVDVGFNMIKEFNCSSKPLRITQLIAQNNFLHSILCIDRMNFLVELNLSWNNFEHLDPLWFKDMKDIKIIDFSCNPLIKLDVTAMSSMGKSLNLTNLDVRIKFKNSTVNGFNQSLDNSSIFRCN